ncbi:class I SAM-dependent methyltransferase [Novispirillum sp. DQ9]|uniref:class I SAM-dependent methyltransferase n=1 Tax=Novispirillum sp. DQ9 TaxID=3398612 RepID=UPI003C7B7248
MAESLEDRLRARIEADGPLPLEAFMGAAVDAYYAQGDVFGQRGDFTTAPEICQVFGEIIGLWAVVAWQSMGCHAPLRLVELGPGRGTLMKDALRAAAAVPAFAAAVEVHLVERSDALRARQREALAGRMVRWHDDLAEVPAGPLLVIANEFFDALPITQLERTPDGWHHRLVGLDDADAFVFVAGPRATEAEIAALGPAFADCAPGAIAERSPASEAVAAALGRRLAADGGAALIIDYGYAESAPGDTLQALRRHAFHPPLESPGEVDLTAHVDFARLAEAARQAGATAFGPVGQGRFLSGLGAEIRAKSLIKKARPEQAVQISSGLHRLIHPAEMGTLFKVLALAGPDQPPLPGFEGPSSP